MKQEQQNNNGFKDVYRKYFVKTRAQLVANIRENNTISWFKTKS